MQKIKKKRPRRAAIFFIRRSERVLTLKLGIGDVSIDLIIADAERFRLLRADLLSVRSDLVVVLIGEVLDRKYFTELTDVAVDVPTFKFEVVGFFITFGVEVVTTFSTPTHPNLSGAVLQ
mgnify:CR=1 FL=1